jgi:2-aminoadipate transaminase
MKHYLRVHSGGDHAGRTWDAAAIAGTIAATIERHLEVAPHRPPPPETSLPPAGALALQLGVSAHTVGAAYRLLEERALVIRAGRCFAIAQPAGRTPRPQPAPCLPVFKPVVPANRPARGTPGHITLSSAFLDPRMAPTADIAYCMRSVLRSPGPSTYANVQGYPPLRQLIAERLRPIGIDADPEHILLTIGSQQVLDLACRSVEIKRFATEDPAYIAAKALFQLSDVDVTGLPVDPFTGIDLARWHHLLATRRPSLAYLTTNFQNPTGYSYSSGELHQILQWSEELGFGILEDDWGSDMLPHVATRPTLRALGGDHVLYMNAFTKKTLPSLRVGFVVCNERTLPSLLQSKKLSINGSPTMIEETLFELIDQGFYDEHLRRTQAEVGARYRHCLEAMRALLPDSVRWTLPGGGPLLWLELPRQVHLEALIDELAQHQILVNPQGAAFAGAPHLHGFMIGYAFPDRAEMTTAIEILARLINQQLRPSRST